ncbi:hypothetical protein L596_023307 [Steinernema carpocapsae]|uniref:Fatty-acid and retinol-binding protein 1 n=1 Tax=Steinernema carpocapsae TaxID=34508 RepID=A0A4V5ZZC5_STECR|nr:hypothetical protein L596_023307 [Steinernema carpocapsae]
MASVSIVLVFCFSAAFALEAPTNAAEKKVFDSLPTPIKTFYTNLDSNDAKLLESLESTLKGKNMTEIIDTIKPKSDKLANGLQDMVSGLTSQIQALPEAGQKFMTNLLTSIENATNADSFVNTVKGAIEKGKNLPKDVKEKLTKDFPDLKDMFN